MKVFISRLIAFWCWFVCISTLIALFAVVSSGDATTAFVIFCIVFCTVLLYAGVKLWKKTKDYTDKIPLAKPQPLVYTPPVKQKTESEIIAEYEAMDAPPVVQPKGIFLKDGEICHFQVPASVVVKKNVVVGYDGKSGGVSFRLAKGVSVRTGGSRATPIRQDVATFYPGSFVITNKRIIMTGEKGFEHTLSRLSTITEFSDNSGLVLQFGKSIYTIKMDKPYLVRVIINLINK